VDAAAFPAAAASLGHASSSAPASSPAPPRAPLEVNEEEEPVKTTSPALFVAANPASCADWSMRRFRTPWQFKKVNRLLLVSAEKW